MAKLVLGTSKQTVVPAVVRDKSPAYYIEKTPNGDGKLVTSTHFPSLQGVTDIGNYVFSYQYTGLAFPQGTTLSLSPITSVSGGSAFYSAFMNTTGIDSVDASTITTISGYQSFFYAFRGSGVKNIDFSSLTTISGDGCLSSAFSGTQISEVDFPALTTFSRANAMNGTFASCSELKKAKFNKLSTITAAFCGSTESLRLFAYDSKLEDVEFGGVTASTFASVVNQLQSLFTSGCGKYAPNGCTVHFPSNFDPSDPNHTFDASTLAGYPTFGGSAEYIHVAFDLPATE